MIKKNKIKAHPCERWAFIFKSYYAGTGSLTGSITGVSTGSGVAGTGVRSRLIMRSGSPISAIMPPIS